MKIDLEVKPSRPAPSIKSLTSLLSESERVKQSVAECAEELSSVNVGIKRELAVRDSLPGIEDALEKSVAIEDKVQEASKDLSVVNRALENEVNERHLLEQQLAAITEQGDADRHASLHDALTGLPNRVLFDDRLEHGLAQAARHGRTLAVMFLDLDGFKQVNDRHGHGAGDGVLRMVAERLKNHTRSDDTVGRHGGDEFLCLFTEVRDEQSLASMAEQIINVIQAPSDVVAQGLVVDLVVKVSIGIAIWPKDGKTADVLIANADKAMYLAKEKRSGYSFTR